MGRKNKSMTTKEYFDYYLHIITRETKYCLWRTKEYISLKIYRLLNRKALKRSHDLFKK